MGTVDEAHLAAAEAQWIDRDTVAWRVGPADGREFQLWSAPAGGLSVEDGKLSGTARVIALTPVPGGLTDAQRARYPHLWGHDAFTVAGARPDDLRGQLVAVEFDGDGTISRATGVQLPGVLDDLFAPAADETLGVTFAGGVPRLAVWAPTAQVVALELFDHPAAAAVTVAMSRDERTGVWSVTGEPGWTGRYYRYRVTVWQPAARAVVTASVTDPYSVSLATDSTHSQIVDLDDPALAPEGWAEPAPPSVGSPQIQELSVRDFSIADRTVPAPHRGTYLAFTAADSAGVAHLRRLAQAGVSHVHLLPVFDFATVPDRRADQAQPDCDLPSLAPDSDRQQACVTAVADRDGYNWGYDPLHYSTPEGSYATDPEGTPRIVEFRRMVAALHRLGLRVVLDVVYNHTMASGVEAFSVLDQIVPGYYHRLLDDGTVADSTCCANTAPEHRMMGKLVVDSVVLWARQYKVDGFRFDLMGHHPKANLLAVRDALGDDVLLYGEGWNFGEVVNNARFEQATQANMAGTGIGTFNDRLRDAVRGGGAFDLNPRVQGFASGLFTDPNGDGVNGSLDDQRGRLLHYHDLLQVGLTGNLAGYRFVNSWGREVSGAEVDYNGSPAGYTAAPGEGVTYVDAHDNEILFDALAFKLPHGTPADARARMQVLGLAFTVLGQGPGFAAAGSDRLRSKSLDRNSFNSGDWFNQIRWDCADGNGFGAGLPPAADNLDKWPYAGPLLADPALVPGCDAINLAAARVGELLTIRRSSPVFGLPTAEQVQRRLTFPLAGPGATPGVITMVLDARDLDPRWSTVAVVFNATPWTLDQTVSSLRDLVFTPHPVQADSADPLARDAAAADGTFTVPGRTVAVFVAERPE
jgi:pullulanase-type alpha-1,6-glucosidase